MVRLNNLSRYGLVASVFTRSKETFRRLLPQLENGVVHWNRTTAMTPGRLPFGGVKRSGNHRPAGLFAAFACGLLGTIWFAWRGGDLTRESAG